MECVARCLAGDGGRRPGAEADFDTREAWSSLRSLGRVDPGALGGLTPAPGERAVLQDVPARPELAGTVVMLLRAEDGGSGPERRWRVRLEGPIHAEIGGVPTASLVPAGFPQVRGVSLGCLRSFARAHELSAAITAEEVCERMVRPLTKVADASLARCLEVASASAASANGTAFVGAATVFFSYARSSRFSELLQAAEAFVEAQSGPSAQYIWIDLFSQRQHMDDVQQPAEWPSLFRQTVQLIGHTCLVLPPWGAPAPAPAAAKAGAAAVAVAPAARQWPTPPPLTRAWVLWELMCTFRASARLTIQMTPAAAAALHEALTRGELEGIMASACAIDAHQSRARSRAEQDSLHRLMAATAGGIGVLDARASAVMHEWLTAAAKAALARMRAGGARARSALLGQVGALLRDAGALAEAEGLLMQSYAGRRSHYGDGHAETLAALCSLGALRQAQGQAGEAERLLRRALERARALSARHPQTAVALTALGALYLEGGQAEEAEPLLREAVACSRALHGTRHPVTLEALSALATLCSIQKRIEEARSLTTEIVHASRAVRGAQHPRTLTAVGDLGTLLTEQGKLREAEPLCVEALTGSRAVLGDAHTSTLIAMSNLGALRRELKQLDEAEGLFRKALTHARQLGPRHAQTLAAMANLGGLLHERGRNAEAEPLLRSSLEASTVVLGDSHPHTLTAMNNLGVLLRQDGRAKEAERLVSEAARRARRVLGETHPRAKLYAENSGRLKDRAAPGTGTCRLS